MRKSQREVKDPEELRQILESCDVCHLGLSDDGQPYVIALNYGFELIEGQLTLYFHCAPAGRKLDIIRRNDRACFQVDCSRQLRTGELACQYSMNYESMIGSGPVEIVDDPDEKAAGLRILMNHYSGRLAWEFDPQILERTLVLRLKVVEFCGKRLQRN